MQKLFHSILFVCSIATPPQQGPRVTPLTYDFIRHQEKLVLTAYPDPASPRARYRRLTGVDAPELDGSPWTIGYGCTGPHIVEGTKWTRKRADLAFERRVDKLASKLQESLHTDVSQAQFDALLSFAFNVGSGVLRPDSKLMRLVNGKNNAAVTKLLKRWTFASGRHFDGLAVRRMAEIALFNQL